MQTVSRNFAVLACWAGCAGVSCAALAQSSASEWSASAKLSYDRNSGKYGAPLESHDTSTTLTLGLDSEHMAFDLVLPYVAQTGPGRRIVLAGRQLVVLVEPGRTAMGMGDVSLGATRYVLNEETHGFDLDLGGTVKFGTASETKGLGTGKTDYALQATIGKALGPLAASVTGGYTFVGKPAGQDLRNSAYASFDANWRPVKAVTLGATYGYGAPTSSGSVSSRDVTYYASYRVSRKLRIEVSVIDGHSTQSPDRGFGVTVSGEF